MSGSVVRRLVVKDVYLHRYMLVLALVFGLVSVIVSGTSRVGFNVGSVFYLSTVIAFGVILVIYGIAQERKDKALLFVLSLPISPKQYLQAKMLSIFTIFFVPWFVLTAGAVVMMLVTIIPDGLVPFFILVSTFMLMNFTVILCVALLTVNELAITSTVILTNMSVSLFFILLGSIPAIQVHTVDNVVVWSRQFFIVLATQIVVMLIALTLPVYFGRARRGLV
jgi:ABC-2 type transport system permease protein